MNISFLGNLCFRISGRKQCLVCDLYEQTMGAKMPKSQADIITLSEGNIDDKALSCIEGDPFIISGPGEYEIGGVIILGIDLKAKDGPDPEKALTAFLIEMDNWRLCHLGNLKKSLKEKQIELLNGTDILFLPIEESKGLTTRDILAIIEQIEPKIIIPMYKDKATLDKFVKLRGQEAKYTDKLNLKQFELTEESQLVVLEAKK